MCLTDFSDRKVAEKPILCFKFGVARLPFQRFNSYLRNHTYRRYEKQPIMEIRPKIKTVPIYLHQLREIPMGFHKKGEIEEGYHSYKQLNRQIFIIPEGSIYYEGKENRRKKGYVSSSIIWIGSIFNPINWLIVLLYKLKSNKNVSNRKTKRKHRGEEALCRTNSSRTQSIQSNEERVEQIIRY